MFFVPRSIKIPPIFHSLEKDGPFEQCIHCQMPLSDGDQLYLIERIFKGTEPIVEYAICHACHEKLSHELSVESRQRISAFMQERVDLDERGMKLLQREDAEQVEAWLEQCVLTDLPLNECHERHVYGLCRGDQLLLGQLPFMISGKATEELARLLSQATKDSMRDFMDTHFGMPPEFCDSPDFSPILL